LEKQVEEADGIPDQEANVARLNFCCWSQKATRAIDLELWDKNNPSTQLSLKELALIQEQRENQLLGRRCYGGLDLASVSDLSCYVLFFPSIGELPAELLAWFWCPEDDIAKRSKRDKVPYDAWERHGFLTATPGNVTDFSFINHRIIGLHGRYDVRDNGFDRAFAMAMIQVLQDAGCKVTQFGQGFLSMNAPVKELLRMVKSGTIRHGSHPILRFCAQNLVCAKDPAGNLKPDKEKSPEKIDGISASCNAIGRCLVAEPQEPNSAEITINPLVTLS